MRDPNNIFIRSIRIKGKTKNHAQCIGYEILSNIIRYGYCKNEKMPLNVSERVSF